MTAPASLRDNLRHKLAQAATRHPPDYGDHAVANLGPPPTLTEPRPAAVLIAVVDHGANPSIVLTRRADHLAHHPGQVSFPGGRREPDDPDAIATALREAHEEIALHPDKVEVVGSLGHYHTVTGYLVQPVVGVLDPPLALAPDPNEVAAIFEVPLRVALRLANYERRSRDYRGQRRSFYVLPYSDYYIWGATAAMLRQFAQALA